MNRNLIISLTFSILLYFSCSKGGKKDNGPQTTDKSIKIQVLTGNNFADTIDKYTDVTILVTQNGAPLGGYKVYYHGSGCNADHIDSSVTAGNGITGYNWWLSGEVGQQRMGIFGLNAQHQKVDSTTVVGTGIAPGTGWHQSSCTIFPTLSPWSYCELSSGRIFVNFNNGYGYVRYSDDNGRSWYAVKSLGNQREIEYLLSTPADEVFAISHSDGIFYSTDAGQAWVVVNPQAFNNESVFSAVYTPTGKLLVVTDQHPVCISTDKGKTWTNTSVSQFVPANPVQSLNGQDGFFGSPAEDAAGNLYLVADESQTIYKSADNGNTWSPLPNDIHGNCYAFYIDKNNWFYKNISDFTYGGMYISKDNGNTYNGLFSSPGAEMNNISLQIDGNLYEVSGPQGLMSENSITGPPSFVYANSPNAFLSHMPYIVAKNNNIIVTNETYSRIFYYQH